MLVLNTFSNSIWILNTSKYLENFEYIFKYFHSLMWNIIVEIQQGWKQIGIFSKKHSRKKIGKYSYSFWYIFVGISWNTNYFNYTNYFNTLFKVENK